MNLSEITRIVELMSEHELTEIDIKCEDIELTIKRERPQPPAEPTVIAPMAPIVQQPAMPLPMAAPAAAPAPAAPEPEEDKYHSIESPIVGTFYSAPTPDSPPFVSAGDQVTANTVICIVEAMKVMNEIRAETNGIIRKVLVENGQPVEFGQPLFLVET